MNIHSETSLSIHRRLQELYQRWSQLTQTNQLTKSAEYLAWRRRFFHRRLGRGLWIGLTYTLILFTYWLYIFLFKIEQIRIDFESLYGKPWIADHYRDITITACPVIVGLVLTCLLIHKTPWGRRHPAVIFFIFAGAVNGFASQIIATPYGMPLTPSPTVFLAFAVMMPLCWRLHLFVQLLPLAYYTLVLPSLGLTGFRGEPILSVYNVGDLLELGWVCITCDLGVMVYERLCLSEFESRRELQLFLHAVSHDLRNPVMGISIVIKNMLRKAVGRQTQIDTPVLERLLQSSDRQLALINALVEANQMDVKGMALQCQPLKLSTVVEAALADLKPKLLQNKIGISNHIDPDLPLINADEMQLWRVFSNLIENALKHNPHGIHLTLAATVINPAQEASLRAELATLIEPPLKLTPQNLKLQSSPVMFGYLHDNGVGISPMQVEKLFELYTRGNQARRMPGLGLGLYLCKQIITAHGGEIGIISQPGQGSTFWFTLPLAISNPDARLP